MVIEIDRHALAPVNEQPAQIIDAVSMIGVFVRVEHCGNFVDAGIEQLFAQVGRRIDQNPGDARDIASFDEQRRPPAAIFGIVRITVTPSGARPWHATR